MQRAVPRAERTDAKPVLKITLEQCPRTQSQKAASRGQRIRLRYRTGVPIVELLLSLFFVRKTEKLSGTAMPSPQPAVRI
ncbi:hypothetical protein AV540_14125 [Brevibacillus parabrevis]|nr:hypothetical protein AV540_14125 [Brevibacillus parabrevis]